MLGSSDTRPKDGELDFTDSQGKLLGHSNSWKILITKKDSCKIVISKIIINSISKNIQYLHYVTKNLELGDELRTESHHICLGIDRPSQQLRGNDVRVEKQKMNATE